MNTAKPSEATVGERRPKVVYWNNMPSPYIVERFNAVADRGKVQLKVCFSQRTHPERSWAHDEASWRFSYRYLPRVGTARRGMAIPLALITGERPDLVVTLYAAPEFIAGWFVLTVKRVRTAFWAEVTFDSWVRRRRHREWLKRRMFRRVDGLITNGEDGRAFARKYGVSDDRMFVVRNAVDIRHYADGATRAASEREAFRTRAGLTGIVFLFVGRLVGLKGVFDLVDAFGLLREHGVDATLLLVGDGIDEPKIRERAAVLGDRVVFAGFRQKDQMPKWYSAADVLVFPTLGDPYGMVVDEAMACGLPIISTSAVGELGDRVQEGRNGFIVSPEDPVTLAAAMERISADPRGRSDMGAESRKMIDGHTPERWASDFESAVAGILALPRRRAHC